MADYEPLPQGDEDYDLPDYDSGNADQTGAFGPLSSTPAPEPEFQTAQKEEISPLKPPSFLEGQFKFPDLTITTLTAAGEIDKEFPNADKNKIKFLMDRKGRTRVGLVNPKKTLLQFVNSSSRKKWRIPDKLTTSKRSFKGAWRKPSTNNTRRNWKTFRRHY